MSAIALSTYRRLVLISPLFVLMFSLAACQSEPPLIATDSNEEIPIQQVERVPNKETIEEKKLVDEMVEMDAGNADVGTVALLDGEWLEAKPDGYALHTLSSFEIHQNDSNIMMMEHKKIGAPNFIMSIFPLRESSSPDIFVAGFLQSFEGSLISASDPIEVEINGATGWQTDVELTAEAGVVLKGSVVGLQKQETTALIFGSANTEVWEITYANQFDAVLHSVELYPISDAAVTSIQFKADPF